MKLENEFTLTTKYTDGKVDIFTVDYAKTTNKYYISVNGDVKHECTTFQSAILHFRNLRKNYKRNK